MTAPTEAEIREVVTAHFHGYDGVEDKLDETLDKALDAIAYVVLADEQDPLVGMTVHSSLWADLRPTEALRARDLVYEARERLKAALAKQIIEATVATGLAFAAEYPDAPRAERELVSAR